VSRLIRTAVGPVALGDLKVGRWRHLTRGEVSDLFAAAESVPSGTVSDDLE
jgi:23S rRNA pseudouridine2605 synthase